MVWCFIGVYIINNKKFTPSLRPLLKYYSVLEEKCFISLCTGH